LSILFFCIGGGEKLANLADILVTLTLDTSEFRDGLREAGQELNNFRNQVGQVTSNIGREFAANMSEVNDSMASMSAAAQTTSETVGRSTDAAGESLGRLGRRARYLARELGTSTEESSRVLQAASEEFERYGANYLHVSQDIQDNFSALPSYLQRYVQRLSDAGQSTAEFAELNRQMSQQIIQHARASNDYFQQRTSQSQRLMESFAEHTNLAPLTNQFLRLGNQLERNARQGSVLNIALQRIGPTASLRDLQNQMQLISQGIMRAQGAFLVFGVSSALAIYGMTKLAATVDDRVVPAFEELKKTWVDAMEPFIHAWATGLVAVMNFVKGIGELVNAFSEAHPVLFNMIMGFTMLTLVLGTLLAPLAVTGVLAEGLAASFAALWAIIGPFVLGVLAVIGVAMALAAAITALWAAIYMLWTNSEAFRNAYKELWNDLKAAIIDNFVEPVKQKWEELKLKFSELVSAITGGGGSIGSLWQWLGDHLATIVNYLSGEVLPILGEAFGLLAQVTINAINLIIYIVGYFTQLWQQHGSTITTIIDNLKLKFQEGFSAIAAFIMEKMPQIQQIISDGFNLIMTIVEFVMNYIVPLILLGWSKIYQVISVFMPQIEATVRMAWDAVKGIITSALNIIQNAIQLFTNILQGNWRGAWGNVQAIASNYLSLIGNLIKLFFTVKFMAPVTQFGQKALSLVKTAFEGIKNTASNVMNNVLSVITHILNAIVAAMHGNFSTMLSETTAAFRGILSGAKQFLGDVLSTAKSIFGKLPDVMTKPVTKAKEAILKIIDKIVSAFKNMKIEIPKPKLPSINVGSKSFMDGKVKVPTFDISWHAKGGIFAGATLLGGGHGVGEAGSEAVLPIQHRRYMQPFSNAIASNLAKMDKGNDGQSSGNQYSIQFNEPVVIREDADIQRIVDEMERRKRIAERAKGVFSF
jgi:phage-related protein